MLGRAGLGGAPLKMAQARPEEMRMAVTDDRAVRAFAARLAPSACRCGALSFRRAGLLGRDRAAKALLWFGKNVDGWRTRAPARARQGKAAGQSACAEAGYRRSCA